MTFAHWLRLAWHPCFEGRGVWLMSSACCSYFGFDVGGIHDSMDDLLGADAYGNGEKVSAATLKAIAKRVLLSHMRLGFYDESKGDFPFGEKMISRCLTPPSLPRACTGAGGDNGTDHNKN
eukprot:COSAG01_NODE_8495_length_2765_cov_31.726182_5_plen_121_part_00